MVKMTFTPIGENMSLQICYRATDGTPVYGVPVTSGEAALRLDKTPTDNVVFAVICNTDYIYKGDETRKAHFDYRVTPGEGISGTADIYTKWYNDFVLDYEWDAMPKVSLNAPYVSHLSRSGNVKVSLYTAYGALIMHLNKSFIRLQALIRKESTWPKWYSAGDFPCPRHNAELCGV